MNKKMLKSGCISLLMVGFFWGLQYVFNKIALTAASPDVIAAFRVIFATIVVTAYSIIAGISSQKTSDSSYKKTPFWLFLFIAVFEVIVPFYAMALGQQSVSAGYASILTGTVPIYTLVLSLVFLKERAHAGRKIFSILLGFAGLVCLILPSIGDNEVCSLSGALILVGGAFCFSVASMLIRTIKDVHPVIITRNILLIGSVPMMIVVFTHWREISEFNLTVWLSLIALGSFSSAAAYLLYVNLITTISPVFASFANYMAPLFGLLFGCLLFGESVYLSTVVSVMLLALSIVINNPSEKLLAFISKLLFSKRSVDYLYSK